MSSIYSFRQFWPHLLSLAIMLIVTMAYFAPVIFNDKVIGSTDLVQAKGMQAEMRQFQGEDGDLPLWTNSMFGGMPTYQILYDGKTLMEPASKTFLLGNVMSVPWPPIFLMMAGFYFLLMVLRTDWRLALPISVAYGMASYHIDLVAAGHMTKLVALGYLAPLAAGALLAFRGRLLLGGATFALITGVQIYANHLQITFYSFIVIGILALVLLIELLRKKQPIAPWGKAVGALALATVLGVAANLGRLWTTYEYTAETIRGQSELTIKGANASGGQNGEDGLSKEYIFQWSYGKLETFNTLIPNFMGGSSGIALAQKEDSETLKVLRTVQDPNTAQQLASAARQYWGEQPFTGGPIYFGAVMWLLFFIGCFLVRGPTKVWLIAATIFTLMLAWGDNFKILNYFLVDYVPMFNKFRAVTMAMGLTQFTMLLLGVLGLREVFRTERPLAERKRGVLLGGAVAAGLVLLGLVLSYVLDLSSEYERSGFPQELLEAMSTDRAALLRSDALRSLLFVGLGLGAIYAFIARKISAVMAVILVGLFAVVDQWGIALRFLSAEDFTDPEAVTANFEPSPADKAILQDETSHYRVANLASGNPFSDALTSMHHRHVGGYHAAKLMRYNELIEYLISPGEYRHLYNMMNVKYFITDPNGRPQINPEALGNAWFVDALEIVPTVDAEYAGIKDFDPATTALVAQPYAEGLSGFDPDPSGASIELTDYHPDRLTYRYSASSEQFAVFSEVYYPADKGWQVYLDGERYDDFTKVNFVLRGLTLPAGQDRELKMVFEPTSYYTGETIALIASILVLLGFFAALFFFFKNNKQDISPENLPPMERTVEGTGKVLPADKKTTTKTVRRRRR